MKKTVEIICTLDMRLIKPEQLEWISINKDDIEASCITIGEVVNVNIVLWESYRIDTGQCDQDNGLEYLIGEESIEYNIIYNDIGFQPTKVNIDGVSWTHKIDNNTGDVIVTTILELDLL